MYESQKNVTEPNMHLFGFSYIPDNATLSGKGQVCCADPRLIACILGRLPPPLSHSPISRFGSAVVSPPQHLIQGWDFGARPVPTENIPANKAYVS